MNILLFSLKQFFVPASAFMFATRHFTYRIPSMIYDRKAFFKFVRRLYSPLKKPMALNAVLQTLIAFYIVHMAENQFFYLEKAINEQNEEDDATLQA